MLIKIWKKVEEFNSSDFVKYFCLKYKMVYSKEPEYGNITGFFAKNSMIMKRVVSTFQKNDKPKRLVLKFVDWVFDEYTKREFTQPLTIGFLPYWIDEFFKCQKIKVIEKKNFEMTDEIREWLRKEKEKLKEKFSL